jgi:hypothetical protein
MTESRGVPGPERLRLLARGETRRLRADRHMAPDPARVAEGWERRFVAEGARAEEMMQFYRDLGFEVAADPVAATDLPGGCESCRLVLGWSFRVIYTRKPRARADSF